MGTLTTIFFDYIIPLIFLTSMVGLTILILWLWYLAINWMVEEIQFWWQMRKFKK